MSREDQSGLKHLSVLCFQTKKKNLCVLQPPSWSRLILLLASGIQNLTNPEISKGVLFPVHWVLQEVLSL